MKKQVKALWLTREGTTWEGGGFTTIESTGDRIATSAAAQARFSQQADILEPEAYAETRSAVNRDLRLRRQAYERSLKPANEGPGGSPPTMPPPAAPPSLPPAVSPGATGATGGFAFAAAAAVPAAQRVRSTVRRRGSSKDAFGGQNWTRETTQGPERWIKNMHMWEKRRDNNARVAAERAWKESRDNKFTRQRLVFLGGAAHSQVGSIANTPGGTGAGETGTGAPGAGGARSVVSSTPSAPPPVPPPPLGSAAYVSASPGGR